MDGNDFSFITPAPFRKNIIESVEFTAWLWVAAKGIEKRFVDDINRTIILYNISIIEALLLFRVRKLKIKFMTQEYKKAHELPIQFRKANQSVVVAFRENITKADSQIWLNDLLREQQNFLGDKLHQQIKTLQDARNTLHLSKKRSERFTLQKSQASFDALLAVVTKMKKEIKD